eukprot:1161681-Pelagomonas_calceolata.AAC.19
MGMCMGSVLCPVRIMPEQNLCVFCRAAMKDSFPRFCGLVVRQAASMSPVSLGVWSFDNFIGRLPSLPACLQCPWVFGHLPISLIFAMLASMSPVFMGDSSFANSISRPPSFFFFQCS